MLAEVLGLVLCDEVVERPNHVRQEAVVFTRNGRGQNAIFVPEEMCVVDVEGGQSVQSHAPYLGNVVFVCGGHGTRGGKSR